MLFINIKISGFFCQQKRNLFHLIRNPPVNHLSKEFQLISCIEVYIQTLGLTTLVYATLLSVIWVSPHVSKFFVLSLWNAETKLQVPFRGTSSIIFGRPIYPCSALGMTLPVGFGVRGVLGSSLDSRLQEPGIGWLNCSSPDSCTIAGLRCTSRQQWLRQLVETFQLSDSWSLIHRQWLEETQKKLSTRVHSIRMRTARLLPVSPNMHCSGGVPCPGGYLVLGVYLIWGAPGQGYLVLGVCTWSLGGPGPRGTPDPRGAPGPNGVPGPGGTLSPWSGGCAWSRGVPGLGV